MSKSKTEKKLLKNTSKFAALEAELQLIFPLKVFAQIEDLARVHLETNKYDFPSRDRISRLAFILRQETFAKYGHESLETIALAKLLRPTPKGWQPKPPRLDAISHMRGYSKHHRMDAHQEAAADMIKRVWDAFGRFRLIGGRGMEGGRGGGQVLHPLDVMGDELWEHYCKVYKPWYLVASKISIHRRRYSEGSLSLAALVFKVLVEDFFPEEVDNMFACIQGTCYRGLRAALSSYYDPPALESFIKSSVVAGTVVDERSGKPLPKP